MDFIPRDFIFFINSSKKEDIQSRATKANSICENIRHVYEDLEAHIKEHTDSKYDLEEKSMKFTYLQFFATYDIGNLNKSPRGSSGTKRQTRILKIHHNFRQ